jgi:two-component system cell cycle sensor histidine kinase/response regulator CckA
MLATLPKDDTAREGLEEIRAAGDRAATLIHQLLAFSRKQILEPVVMSLNETVYNMDKMLRRIIGEDIELRTILASDLGLVEVDMGQIEQVIMNLAVNARDAMPEGGKLTIETANVDLDKGYTDNHIAVIPGPYVMLSVSDTGAGMTKEVREQVFDPFFTTKEKGKGTGLGLSMVYGIVKQSKGNIWVYSEPRKGATFKVYLPRVEKSISAEEKKEKEAVAVTGSETILIVEDDDMVRNFAAKVLKKLGYTILIAADGQEAISISGDHQGPIHLILTDVVMPGISGAAVEETLRDSRPGIKVLYMSGHTDNAIVHHGVLGKGKVFLQKPFTPDALARKVREVLGD